MKTIIFATNNADKVAEVRRSLPEGLQVQSLKEAGINIDIPEPYHTFHENASTKSRTIQQLTGTDCFSEDSGLMIEALQGAPGVQSARFAGEQATYTDNVDKVLQLMQGETNRRASFITVVSLQWEGREYFFEGTVAGTITEAPRGHQGFGYDPIFVPDGEQRSFAEMTIDEKKQRSHRAKAVKQLFDFLQQQYHGQSKN